MLTIWTEKQIRERIKDAINYPKDVRKIVFDKTCNTIDICDTNEDGDHGVMDIGLTFLSEDIKKELRTFWVTAKKIGIKCVIVK